MFCLLTILKLIRIPELCNYFFSYNPEFKAVQYFQFITERFCSLIMTRIELCYSFLIYMMTTTVFLFFFHITIIFLIFVNCKR
jgi:hypothetical protein